MNIKSLKASIDKLKSEVAIQNQSYHFIVADNEEQLEKEKQEFLSGTNGSVTFVVLKV